MVQGVISKVFDKPFGNKTFYSFGLKGVDGFFGTGVKRPPKEGTYVKFNEKKNSRGYLEVDGSIEILPSEGETGPVAGVAGAVSASAKTGGTSQSAYWDRKEARDIANDSARELGASRNTAIALIDLALKNEVFKLPAAAKREDFLWTVLDKYTDRLMGKNDAKLLEGLEKPEDLSMTADPESDNWS